jgi:integrase
MFDSYQKKAGIVRIPCDGKGFHSLRRLLGREMTIAEIPITTIAQVLGHSKTNSTTQYISLDSQHLKMCALDFRGITVERGDLLI